MKIAGLTRELPLCPINEHLKIAAFIMFSDVEITIAAAKELLKKCGSFDVILTAEAKGIPLAYEMSRQSGKPYVVARKSKKLYMKNPISVYTTSITTSAEQTLILSEDKANMLKGKRVLIADDVISTGESLLSLEELVKSAGGEAAVKAAVLAEGNAANRDDIIYLEKLPLFEK